MRKMLDNHTSRESNSGKRREMLGKRMHKKERKKFFGHSVCKEHTKNIPGPLEVYAASWISAGEDIDIINEGLDKIFNKGEEYEVVKGNTTTPIEWF